MKIILFICILFSISLRSNPALNYKELKLLAKRTYSGGFLSKKGDPNGEELIKLLKPFQKDDKKKVEVDFLIFKLLENKYYLYGNKFKKPYYKILEAARKRLKNEKNLTLAHIPILFSAFDHKEKEDLIFLRRLLPKILKEEADDSNYYRGMSLLHEINTGEKDFKFLEKAIEKAKDKYEKFKLYKLAAYRHKSNGDIEKQINVLKQISELYPNNFYILNNIGVAYQSLKDQKNAGIYYKKVLKFNNNSFHRDNYLGSVFYRFYNIYNAGDMVYYYTEAQKQKEEKEFGDIYWFLLKFHYYSRSYNYSLNYISKCFLSPVYARISPYLCLTYFKYSHFYLKTSIQERFNQLLRYYKGATSPVSKIALLYGLLDYGQILNSEKSNQELDNIKAGLKDLFLESYKEETSYLVSDANNILLLLIQARLSDSQKLALSTLKLVNKFEKKFNVSYAVELKKEAKILIQKLHDKNYKPPTALEVQKVSLLKPVYNTLDEIFFYKDLILGGVAVLFLIIFLKKRKKIDIEKSEIKKEKLRKSPKKGKRTLIINSSRPNIASTIGRYLSLLLLSIIGFSLVLTYYEIIPSPLGLYDYLVYGPGNEVRIENWPPVVKKIYPDLKLIDSNGKKFSLSELRGRPVVIEVVGMTCTGCHAYTGGNKIKKKLDGRIAPQRNVKSFEQYCKELANVDLFNSDITFLQILAYDLHDKRTKPKDAKVWVDHFFADGLPKNMIVAVPEDSLVSPETYRMIPGFHLIDGKGVLRSVGYKNGIYMELIPMVPVLLSEHLGKNQ